MKSTQQLDLPAKASQISEDASVGAVSATDVAAYSMPMLHAAEQRSQKKKPFKIIPIKYTNASKKKSRGMIRRFWENVTVVDSPLTADEKAAPQDTVDVMSKLKSLEQRERVRHNYDAAVYGLEDSKGKTVKVTVPRDQAANFENALSSFLHDSEQRDGAVQDIAEILFNLKDHFDIIDVEWGEVEENEEENQQLELDQGDETEDLASDPQAGMDDGMDATLPEPTDSGEVESLLQQLIDAMKADAEARKADAVARQREAETRTVSASAEMTKERVKQEEQMLDMEAWEAKQKNEEKEAKRVAKLAKWQHDMSQSRGMSFEDNGANTDYEARHEENEEVSNDLRAEIKSELSKDIALRQQLRDEISKEMEAEFKAREKMKKEVVKELTDEMKKSEADQKAAKSRSVPKIEQSNTTKPGRRVTAVSRFVQGRRAK